MAYARGGIFRSRFIAPQSQRATEILSKPVITQARLDYEATAGGSGTAINNSVYTLGPLTVASAAGQERLVFIGGTSLNAGAIGGDIKACTIDGQVATRVGVVSRAFPASGSKSTFVTAYRAPGTANTSITLSLTVGSLVPDSTVSVVYAACFTMRSVGTVTATAASTGNDPTLSLNAVASGATIAGVYGEAVSGTSAAAWSGVTERVDTSSGTSLFTVASSDNSVTLTPQGISVDVTPDLTGATASVAGLSLSFNPVLAGSVPALSGNYAMTGAPASPSVGHRIVAAAGSYAMTGTAASVKRGPRLAADPGSYIYTGINANLNPSAGATASSLFDAAVADGADKTSSQTYSFALTVAAASGERLAVLGGISGSDGDYSACTIDGQTGTRVGTVSRGVADSSGYMPFLTAFRAPGTGGTSINVVATVAGTAKTQTSGYCANFRMSGAGSVYAALNNNVNDPALSTDVVNRGTVVAALLGYADTSPVVTWSGLTEQFDAIRTVGTEVFSGASADISGAIAPAFRAVSSTTYADRPTSTVVDKPVGTVDGDIMVMTVIGGRPDAANITFDTIPSGWTQVGTMVTSTDAANSFNVRMWVYWKRAASEGATYTFLHTNSIITQISIASYSGCLPSGDPIDVFSQASGVSATATAIGVTTSVTNTKLVYTGHNWDGSKTLTPPTGMTERFDDVVYHADQDLTAVGVTGNRTQALASNNPWQAYLVALKPASSPRPISANITPDLLDAGTDSVASICLSFRPAGATGSALAAAVGSYRMTGTAATTAYGRKASVTTVGSYALVGTDASARSLGKIAASPGSYLMTGRSAATIRSGANKLLDVLPGAYALLGATAVVKRGTKLAVTSVGAYNMVGTTPITTGMGLIAVAGSYAMLGTAATLVKRSGPNISIVVGSPQLTASAGSPLIRTTVGVSVSGAGNVATVSVGNPSVIFSGGISVQVTAPAMTASVGTVAAAISGGIDVFVNGFGLTADVGNETVLIPARVTVTGNFMTASVGTALVNILGSANATVFGNQLDASVGSVTFTTNANVSVTGNAMTASVGTVEVFTLVGALATGNEMTASVGDVTVTAKQNTVVEVQGHALVAFVGTLDFAGGGTITHPSLTNREGQMLKPTNWMGG